MQYLNVTPITYVERHSCDEISQYLSPFFPKSVTLVVRAWDQAKVPVVGKYILIVTSAEGHDYIPDEVDDPACLGVFMHYYPKKSIRYQFVPGEFIEVPKLYPLPLGTTKFFSGDSNIHIQNRPIDVSFIGQYDPYRRVHFFECINKYGEQIDNSVFHFYEGWNNGIGDKYSEIMSNTKIALVPWGSSSLDTFRYYEAAKCGCIILTICQNNYEFMAEPAHIEIESWEHLKTAVDTILSKKRTMTEAYHDTIDYWESCLSPNAATNYILSKIGQ